MTDWTRKPMVGFDFETSGVDVETDRIVTGCVVRWGGGLPTVAWNYLSDLGGAEIPAAATAIHGITTEQAHTEGRPAAEVVEEVTARLAWFANDGFPVVAMNASFDLTLLDREASRYGVRPLFARSAPVVLDPRVLDKQVMPYRRGPRDLTSLAGFWCVKITGAAHEAEADARTACGVVHAIGRRYPHLARQDLGELHEKQVHWARQQNEDLRAYFARTPGKEERAVGMERFDWPLIPASSVRSGP